MSNSSALPAIILMGLITFSFRLLPFLLKRSTKEIFGPRLNRALNALGPSLLVSISMLVIIPQSIDDYKASVGAFVLFVVALVIVLIAHRFIKNVGISILVAMLIYGILLYSGLFNF